MPFLGKKTQHGNPFYDSSKTKQILGQMAKDGLLDQYKGRPAVLKASNSIFNEFSAVAFRDHVKRERRRVNEFAGWQLRRNMEGSKRQHARYEKAHKK